MSAETRFYRELLPTAARATSIDHFLADILPLLANWAAAQSAAVWIAREGHWQCLTRHDAPAAREGVAHLQLEPPRTPPQALLAEAADAGTFHRAAAWSVWPIACTAWPSALLVLERGHPAGELALESLHAALEVVHARSMATMRAQLLRRLLDASLTWHQTADRDELRHQISSVSRELLDADRAIVYLWDASEHTLVGGPFPEMESGVLRIPDTAGLPGRTIHTREVHTADTPQELDDVSRQIDRLLDEQTRNLICLPLISPRVPAAGDRRPELLGALEVRNRNLDSTREVLHLLAVELAAQASSALAHARECARWRTANQDQTAELDTHGQLLGQSAAMARVRHAVQRVAASDLAVLILGENGTGKEIASRQIHRLSARRSRPFVAVNCAAITESLLESELFGHEKGAFTDAHEARLGKFELAAGGTLFLDEIGELPLSSQVKLLRVLEEKVVTRVGGTAGLTADTRIIAATNRDLAARVRAGQFREDLFYRLNVVTIELPPLRARGEDVLLLADCFLDQFCRAAQRDKPRFTRAAQKRLQAHTWPGNVRELRNLMERVAYLLAGSSIDEDDLLLSAPALQPDDPQGATLTDATRQFQVSHIEQQIRAAAGNMTEAARRLGLHRSNLYRKMKQLGMHVDDESDPPEPPEFLRPAVRNAVADQING